MGVHTEQSSTAALSVTLFVDQNMFNVRPGASSSTNIFSSERKNDQSYFCLRSIGQYLESLEVDRKSIVPSLSLPG